MGFYFYILIFIFSCLVLSWLSSSLVKSLMQIARYLQWREFIIAFFVMAMAASLPNLFVDLNAALHHLPELAFGDIIGGNLVDLTLVLAIAVFASRKGISAESEMVQKSAMVTAGIAILPLLLVWDSALDRIDGVILIVVFLLYAWWLFSKKERFKKTYAHAIESPIKGFKGFLVNIIKVIILLALLLAASQAVVASAQFFSTALGLSMAMVGILIVGLGNCFPELYFSVVSARKDENWLVLGDLMGSVIITSTLVLGIVGLVSPFAITNFSPFFTARVFLITAAIFSLVFIRTDRKITKKEGLFLLVLYLVFLLAEIALYYGIF